MVNTVILKYFSAHMYLGAQQNIEMEMNNSFQPDSLLCHGVKLQSEEAYICE